jgi:O-antigen/teichoic acid export membrane protein
MFNSILQKYLKISPGNYHMVELVQESSVALIFKIISMILGYIFALLITRTLGAYTMGVFVLSITLLDIFTIFGKLGLENASLRFIAEYSAQNKIDIVKEIHSKVIMIVLFLCIFLSFLMYILAPILSKDLFQNEKLLQSFQIISFALLPTVFLIINLESIRGLQKIKQYSFLQNIPGPFLSISAFLILSIFYKVEHLPLICHILGVIFLCILSFFIWQKNVFQQFRATSNIIQIKILLKTSFPMFLSSSLFMIMGWTDTLMLGFFCSEEEVGIYSIALKISLLTSITLYAVNTIAAPKFAELYGKKDSDGLRQVAQNSSKIIFWSSFPLLIFFILFPKLILSFFGNDFRAGSNALIILSFGQFINAVSGSVGYILQMTGKEKIFQYIILIAALINITFNFFLIPRFGINGAAFASMISMIFWNLSSVVYIKLFLGINTLYLPMIKKIFKI